MIQRDNLAHLALHDIFLGRAYWAKPSRCDYLIEAHYVDVHSSSALAYLIWFEREAVHGRSATRGLLHHDHAADTLLMFCKSVLLLQCGKHEYVLGRGSGLVHIDRTVRKVNPRDTHVLIERLPLVEPVLTSFSVPSSAILEQSQDSCQSPEPSMREDSPPSSRRGSKPRDIAHGVL